MKGVRFLFFFLLFICSTYATAESPCIETKGSCACKVFGGWINLEPLNSKDPYNPRFTNVKEDAEYEYSYNPCSDFSYGGCHNVAICQSEDDIGYPVGNQSSAVFGRDSFTSMITITYSGIPMHDVTRTGVVSLSCDPDEEGTLSMRGESPKGTYSFVLTSKYACPVEEPNPTTTPPKPDPEPEFIMKLLMLLMLAVIIVIMVLILLIIVLIMWLLVGTLRRKMSKGQKQDETHASEEVVGETKDSTLLII